jgi:hypothetical protein
MWNICVLRMVEKLETRSNYTRLRLDQIRDAPTLIRKERRALLAACLHLIKKKMSIQLARLPLHDRPGPEKYRMQFWKCVKSDRPFSQLL